jgi:FlaG/FlaF family flagellin (archaellin)
MSEINLLQNNVNQDTQKKNTRILNVIGVLLLVITIASYVGLFVLAKQAASSNTSYVSEKDNIQKSIMASSEYPKFVSHQDKLKNIDLLLKAHLGWCTILPSFSAVTLKNTTYNKFDANADGSATVSGTVPDFQNLAKLIQAYQYNEDQFVKDVKLVNVGIGSAETNSIQYTINITFNKEVLKKLADQCN